MATNLRLNVFDGTEENGAKRVLDVGAAVKKLEEDVAELSYCKHFEIWQVAAFGEVMNNIPQYAQDCWITLRNYHVGNGTENGFSFRVRGMEIVNGIKEINFSEPFQINQPLPINVEAYVEYMNGERETQPFYGDSFDGFDFRAKDEGLIVLWKYTHSIL